MIVVHNYQAFTGLMIYSITYKSISLYKLYVKKSLQVSNYIKMKFFFLFLLLCHAIIIIIIIIIIIMNVPE